MSTKSEISAFHSLEYDEKVRCCLSVLRDSRSHGWIFLELYELVSSRTASDKTLADIYESALVVLHDNEQQARDAAIGKLRAAQDNLIRMREIEMNERARELKEVASPLYF